MVVYIICISFSSSLQYMRTFVIKNDFTQRCPSHQKEINQSINQLFYQSLQTVVAVIDCDIQPCKNNAKCHQGSHCECLPGWTGLLCEIPGSISVRLQETWEGKGRYVRYLLLTVIRLDCRKLGRDGEG